MAKKERLLTKRVNFFDGQLVTEKDLDTEQINNNALVSNRTIDFHGSGIVKDSPFEDYVLLDTRQPGEYSASSNSSKVDIDAGTFDGKAIYLDRQPSDSEKGVRLEFELVDADVKGRDKTKVLLIGKIFNGVSSSGNLNIEFIEFSSNGRAVSSHYYTSIVAVIFNNFSGGSGKTAVDASKESLNLIGDNGYMIIREAPRLSVYPFSKTSYQIESPNYDFNHFITSSTLRTLEDEIEIALSSGNTINDLYIEKDGKEQLTFDVDGKTTIAYGQKFLSKTNNIQKISLLLSVEKDTTAASGHEYDFSGELVLALYELATDTSCVTDAVPDDMIDFDPEITPIIEVSLNQLDLENLGYSLDSNPQVVSFDLSSTLIADPNIDPTLEKDKYYAFTLSRHGDNSTGTVVLEKGYDKVSKKTEDSIPLTIREEYAKQESKFFEYDPITKRYVNDSTSSLWYIIHTDAIEVTDGTAYTEFGKAVTVQKTEPYVGGTFISSYLRDIPLRTVSEGVANYVLLSQEEEFSDIDIHPTTNRTVFTRIQDVPSVSVVNKTELDDISSDVTPLILAKVIDNNVRDAEVITGEFDKPGVIGIDEILIVSPSNSILGANLVNRIITPDTDCDCNSMYRIARVDCEIVKAGDLDSDGSLTNADLSALLNIVGKTINSETTEREILGGTVDVLDLIKADLNADGTIDGDDISLLEDAIDGYVNFTLEEEFRVLRLKLENILESSDYPTVFTDTGSSGVTTTSTATIYFTTTEKTALVIRPGDILTIPSTSADAGDYVIETKTVAADGVTVTLTLLNKDGTTPSFSGDTGINVEIVSGTRVNVLADNQNLVAVPFVSKSYEISMANADFESRFVNVLDLSRDVGVSFIEEVDTSCLCEETDCAPQDSAEPLYKNQTYLPGDLYLPNGNIMKEPGVPHPGDFEFTKITMPLPQGSIENCTIDLYNVFIKSQDGTCETSAGFPAMKYSDGTLVGCEDNGTDTDITKGRVKFSNSVASICVDAIVDGYADGLIGAELTEVTASVDDIELITEEFIDFTYTSFSTWTEDALNDTAITNITHTAGSTSPAIFELATSTDSGTRFGRLDSPAEAQDFAGDFIVDFKATRTTWQSSTLTSGTVSSFGTLVISNTDTTTSTLKLGWKVTAGGTTKLFYSGVKEDALSTVLSSFSYEVDAPDTLGQEVFFRFRRIDDAVFAYYIVPESIAETADESMGEYVRIGSNPTVQPGTGTSVFTFEIEQKNSPNAGKSFFVRLSEVLILSEYTSDDTATSITLARDNATHLTSRFTATFPFNLPKRTSIVSANLTFTAESTYTAGDTFNIIPLNILNADNIGKIYNIPTEDNASLLVSFTPTSFVAGDQIQVDVTYLYSYLLSRAGHLPGFIKGFVVEPDSTADSSMTLSSTVTLDVTYLDETTGVVFKVGVNIDLSTGIVTFNTRNILYDSLTEANRTKIEFGVYLKKSGFANQDLQLSVNDLKRFGVGTCFDETTLVTDDPCYFIVGSTTTGSFVEGPYPCN